jgi:LTXXQ motif family protein
MRNIGAYIFVGAFAALISSPTPSAAFGLHLGPLHFGLPFFGHSRHRHHAALQRSRIYDRAAAERPSRAAAEERPFGARNSAPMQSVDNSALLYPSLALPALYDQIFWPGRAPSWPFGYDAIFDSALAKKSLAESPQACQPGDANAVVDRIRAEIKPSDAQMPLFQKLARALGTASGYLAQACPKAIPPQPVARLQLMQAQIQTLSMALDQIRPPLQQLEQSLNADQRSHFAAFSSATAAAGSCATPPAAVDRPVNEIEQRVAPSEDQREALAALKQAFAGAASDLAAHCPKPSLAMPLARLEAMESQLDASWRAALAMQVALAQFESGLTDQQRSRFDALAVTAGND